MEYREFAERVLHADTLEGKLFLPPDGIASLTDNEPGKAVQWKEPARPPGLEVSHKRNRKRIPHPDSLGNPEMAIRCLHTFANHELMAVELMAWAILAYPDAPPAFRAGVIRLIVDEQEHFQLYRDRIRELGAEFGDLPLNDHFWRGADKLTTPLKWSCAMNLTFEQGNLDHAPFFEEKFRQVDDERSAQIMARITADEIHHVGFGVHWLKQHTPPGQSTFEVYRENLTYINDPLRAKGQHFNAENRRKAGLDDDFIHALQNFQ